MTVAWQRVVTLALAVVVGLPLGFFFVLAPLFTDAPSGFLHPERLVSYALSFGLYLLAGGLFGLVRARDYGVVCALTTGAAVMTTVYVLGEIEVVALGLVYLVLVVVAAGLGVWLASRLKPGDRAAARTD